MTERDSSKARSLDPVVVEALISMTERVYPRRGPRLRDKFRRYRVMLDSSARSHAISIFNHLTHAGYEIPPFLVRRWATTNGWKTRDAQLLDDYAAGVLAGVRYHYQDTAGRHSMKEWQRHAEGKKPWMDPGRLE
ncbi:MAG: hypothetical protein HKL85_12080 [Acidimicrobiaceae bacterium]|nr:hypothetical protein [Acidimicrobiaceae bacterium]